MTTPGGTSRRLLPLVRTAFAAARLSELTDGELLARFVSSRDEDAFAELVRRFGPTVFGVCRSIVGNAEDAEDAFQVTFMVLARKAANVCPPGRVGGWLHGVALLAARKARAARARRAARETAVAGPIERAAPDGGPESDLAAVLHEELNRLPDRFRLPIVLCELRELTLAQTAVELGWPVGTVASRLSRGREWLAARLKRRGLAAVATTAALSRTATAVPPLRLLGVSASAARGEGAVPPTVVPALLNEVLGAMTVANVRTMCLGLLATVALTAAAAGFAPLRPAAPAAVRAAAPIPAAPAAPAADPLDRVKAENLADLLAAASIEKELGLTADQKAKVEEAQGKLGSEVKVWFEKMATDIAGAAQKAGPNVGLDKFDFDEIQKMQTTFDKAVLAVLKPEQTRRLKQIILQRMGPAALLDRVVIRTLGLTAEQEDRLDSILSALKLTDVMTSQALPTTDPKTIKRIDRAWAAALKELNPQQRSKWDALVGKRLPTAELLKIDPSGGLQKLLNTELEGLFPPNGAPAAPGGVPPGE